MMVHIIDRTKLKGGRDDKVSAQMMDCEILESGVIVRQQSGREKYIPFIGIKSIDYDPNDATMEVYSEGGYGSGWVMARGVTFRRLLEALDNFLKVNRDVAQKAMKIE
ncbi:MAG: hypothetical protein ACRCTP_04210 [Aeromonas popoffii]|uniref:hypothetical protein n=1 Tax=Aeromonas popoffii TaxID=70856 RepID=UPI003F3EB228